MHENLPGGRSAGAAKLRTLVIVPAFNEADTIAEVVGEIVAEIPWADVVVIDDGSTDATAERVPPPATVVRLPFNLGIGGAMQTGYLYAEMNDYDLAVQVDGDGQHPPGEVPALVEHLQESGADMVIGSRFLRKGDYDQLVSRRLGARVLAALIRLLSGQRITDCTSGFRLANRRVIRAFAHWYPDDYPEPEVALLLRRSGYRLSEVPVRMRQRAAGRSSIPLVWGVFYVIKVAASLLLDTIRNPWPKGKVDPE